MPTITNKMKVLVIGPSPERSQGGMAQVINNILNDEKLNESFEFSMHASSIGGKPLIRWVFSLLMLIRFAFKNKNYDVFHIHVASGISTWRKNFYLKLLGNKSSRAVLHVHGAKYDEFYLQCSDRQKSKVRSTFASAGKTVVLSQEWYDFFLENSLCAPWKLTVLHNAVDIPEIVEKDYSSQKLLFLGKLCARKSPDTIIYAAELVLEKHPSVEFYFGGDGDIEHYKKLAECRGVIDNCHFLGWVSGQDREELFSVCDMFCLPSANEGMPMSVLEAMAYGLATIATPVGGVPQLINDQTTGYIVPVGSYEALSEVICTLVEDRLLKERIALAGRKSVIDQFSMDIFSDSLQKIYETTILAVSEKEPIENISHQRKESR